MDETVIHVCTTCTAGAPRPDSGPLPGARLYAALAAQPWPAGVRVVPVECLSACKTGCAVAVQAPGKWAYVYGHLDPALHAADILAGAARHAASADGIVPWRERPEVFRKQSIARLPPLGLRDHP